MALETLKPNVRERSGFGDNHHNAIDACVRVFREKMTDNDVHKAFGSQLGADNSDDDDGQIDDDTFEQNVLDSALDATRWLWDKPESTEEPPSLSGWPMVAGYVSAEAKSDVAAPSPSTTPP